MSKIKTVIYLILVLLMYIPYLDTGFFRGIILYTYWIIISTLSLLIAWHETMRWGAS